MDIAVLGIDLGKTVCSLAGADGSGILVFRRRFRQQANRCNRQRVLALQAQRLTRLSQPHQFRRLQALISPLQGGAKLDAERGQFCTPIDKLD
jgi:hypothetical protein